VPQWPFALLATVATAVAAISPLAWGFGPPSARSAAEYTGTITSQPDVELSFAKQGQRIQFHAASVETTCDDGTAGGENLELSLKRIAHNRFGALESSQSRSGFVTLVRVDIRLLPRGLAKGSLIVFQDPYDPPDDPNPPECSTLGPLKFEARRIASKPTGRSAVHPN